MPAPDIRDPIISHQAACSHQRHRLHVASEQLPAPGDATRVSAMRAILDYVLEQHIGTGTHTVVYRARRLPGDQLVAVKFAAPHLADETRRRVESRIRHEAHFLDNQRNAAVVPFVELLDGGIDPGHGDAPVTLVTGCADQGSLERVLATRGTLAPTEIQRLGLDLAAGLAALHCAGLVHGRLSASKVLFAGRDTTWLAGLGYAQANRNLATRAEDVYRLGRILRDALTPSHTDELFGRIDAILTAATHPQVSERPSAASLRSQFAQLSIDSPRLVLSSTAPLDLPRPIPRRNAKPQPIATTQRRYGRIAIGFAIGSAVIAVTATIAFGAQHAKDSGNPSPKTSTILTRNASPSDPPDARRPCAGSGTPIAAGAVAIPGDLDGQGCTISATWWPDRAEVERPELDGGRSHFALGLPGDQFILGDWNSDGVDTPGLYRPSTGQIFTFDHWAQPSETVEGSPLATDRRGGVARVVRRTSDDPGAPDATAGDQVAIDPGVDDQTRGTFPDAVGS